MTQMDMPVMQYSTRLLKGASIGRGLLAALLLLLPAWCGTAHAFGILGIPGVYMPQTYLKIGAAYTRAIVPGPSGRPVYVEYNTSGKEAAEIGEATGPLERAKVMPAASYRAYLQRLSDARQRYPESQVMKASEYRGKTFKTVTGETIKKPSISMATLTVLVRADEQLFSTDGRDLLLLELPIKSDVQPSSSSQSLLVSEQGDILHQTANTIGYRVGFHGKEGKVNENLWRDRESKIYGPLAGVPIRLWHEGGTITGEDGRYVMPYMLPPCPGFTFEYKTDAYLELYYKRFNPRGRNFVPYYIVRPDWDFCFGLEVYSWTLMGIKATMATPAEPNIDFPLDLMVLDGAATLRGAKLGNKTEYSSETGERGHYLQQKYDFDGDEKPDLVVPGKKVKKEVDGKEREVFIKTSLEEAELQGIYLSSRYESVPANTEETAPDFTRLIDTAPDFQDRALLETISEADLRDTDIYVFRESNGQMIAERRGLHESELYKSYSGVDANEGSFRYTIHLRGEKEGLFSIYGIDQGGKNFSKWQSAGGFKEEFQKRNANHLKPGEMVRIIAINRPTGYMGSLRYRLESADASGGFMGFTGQRIEMAPPNLKVWAERKNKIEQGMTKGEEKKQLIGNEGAGLGSDISIAIYTDWLDADGTPLPEELADYGYTGRLAKVVAANQLAPVGANNLSQFEIKPGQHVQVIHLPEKVLAKQHLYLQVAGQPSNRNPDFSSGNGSGILKYRPSKFVPVMVPLHDEEASELARQAYRKADKENPQLNLKKPEPMYSWQYRPELQFSLYELNLKEIRKVDAKGLVDSVYGDTKPVIAGSDQLIELFYDMLRSDVGELETWSYLGEKELIFALGEDEVKVKFGKDQSIKFEDLSHLGRLDVDDFLSLRLYSNSDQGNTLLEWAFEYLNVFPDTDEEINDRGEYYFVSADAPQVEMKAILAGYYSRRASAKKPETVVWYVDGAGSMSPQVTPSGDAGIFSSRITMPTAAGSRGRVYATLQGSDAKAYYKEMIVVPGEPAHIEVAFSGALYGGGIGELVADIRVTDRHGNEALQGLSADFAIEGQGRLIEEGASLLSGRGRAVIRNAREAADNNFLVVKVGGVEKKFPYRVGSFRARPTVKDVYEDTEVTLEFSLDGVDVQEFDPAAFEVEVNKGLVLDRAGKIDQGRLVYRWHTGFFPGAATVSFSDGSGSREILEYRVLPKPGSRISDKKPVSLLVDAATSEVSYRRLNGEQVLVPAPSSDILHLRGEPGEKLSLVLGDSENPNEQALLSLSPSQMERGRFVQGDQELAKSAGFRYQLSSVDGQPSAFNYKGYPLELSQLAGLDALAADQGLEIDLIYELDGAGHVLSWRDLFTIEQRADGLHVSHKSGAGIQESQVIALSQVPAIQNLKLSIKGGRIDYQLNGVFGFVDLDDGVEASPTVPVRVLGVQGAVMRRLHVSGRGSAPLITVNGSSTDQVITLDGNGQAQLHVSRVASTLNGIIRHVPLKIADERITVNLYEQAAAIRLLAPVLEVRSLHLDEVKNLLSQDVLSQSAFTPQVRLVAEVLQSSTAEWAKALALFDIYASLPEGRHLEPHRQIVSEFFKTSAPADFTKVYVQELAASISRRQSADLSHTYKRMLGLLVMSEMLAAKPDSMKFVTDSVRDTQDLRVWLDWMAMPANGWALYQPPTPDVQQSCTAGVKYIQEGAAKIPVNPCRLTGEQFGVWVEDFSTILPEFASNPDLMREHLETIYSGLASSNYELRTSLFAAGEPIAHWDPTAPFIQRADAALPALALAPLVLRMVVRLAAKLAVKLGKNAAKNLAKFALGKSNSRIHPMIFLLSAGYLYDEIESGRLQTRKSDASAKFWSTIGLFAGRLALENGQDGVVDIEETLQEKGGYNCRMFNFSHGNMYEIVMIAFYQAMGRKIVELDRPVQVELYDGHTLTRKPDIELEGQGDKNIWIELKSVQAGPSYQGNDDQLPTKEQFLSRFPVFNAQQRLATRSADAEEKRSGSNEYHKQFVLDRLAVYGFDKDGESTSIAKQMHWRFQKWKPKLIKYKVKVAGRNAAGNGYPMSTGVRGSSGKYLDLIKERFAEIPVQRVDFRERLDLDLKGVTQRQFESTQIPLIFSDPAVSELLDGQDDLDEYFLQQVLSRMGYSADELSKLKSYIDGLDAIQRRLEVVTSWWDNVKSALNLDIEDEVLEAIQKKGEELAVDVGLGGSCETTY